MSSALKNLVTPTLAAALLSASLSGCAYFSHDTRWTKAGVSEDEAWSDLDTCKRQARAATQADRSIDQDIAATQGTGAAGTDPLQSTGMTGYQTQKRYEDWVKECMVGFGYQQVE